MSEGRTVNDPCLDIGLGNSQCLRDLGVRDLLGCTAAAQRGEGDQAEFADDGFGGEFGDVCREGMGDQLVGTKQARCCREKRVNALSPEIYDALA